jgi:hypothetical protein
VDGAPPPAGRQDRRGFVALVAAVVVAFGALGGLASYLVLFQPEKSDPAAGDALSVQERPDARSANDSGVGGGERPAESAPDARAATDTPAAEEATQVEETPTETDAAETDGAGATALDTSAAEDVLRRHYELIDAGDYEGAWGLFHPAYRDGAGANWVASKDEGLPRIDLDSLQIDYSGRLSSDMVRLDVELVAADSAGEGGGICRRFVGWTRMQSVGGEWLYRPGEVDGLKPGLQEAPISDSDARCQRVLG